MIKKIMKFLNIQFGIDNDNLPAVINKIAIILRIVTINIDKHYTKRISFISYLLVIVAIACYIYMYIFSLLWFLFLRKSETTDYTAIAISVALSGSSQTCNTKFLFMIFYKDAVQEIVQRYLDCNSQLDPESRFAKNLRLRFRKVKKRAIIFWLLYIVLDVLYLLRPLVTPGRHLPEDSFVLYGLEPMTDTPNYQISFLIVAFATFPAVYFATGVITLILVMIGYTESQMLALSDELLNVWTDAEKFYYENTEDTDDNLNLNDEEFEYQVKNKYVRKRLKEIIIFHITNINLFRDFESIFRITLAAEFCLLIIAIVATLLGGVENTFMELQYSLFLIFINCLIGQKLIDACAVFENAIYDCKWENFDKANRKSVLLMLQIGQKPLLLTAGGLTPLNFICLMSVIKSTYSTYTTLQSTVN